jgi:hypothetical protein
MFISSYYVFCHFCLHDIQNFLKLAVQHVQKSSTTLMAYGNPRSQNAFKCLWAPYELELDWKFQNLLQMLPNFTKKIEYWTRFIYL